MSHKFLLLFIGLLIIADASAYPYGSMNFNGRAIINGGYAPSGSLITANFDDGIICGESVTKNTGSYNIVCTAEENRNGQNIYFRINREKAKAVGNTAYLDFSSANADLIAGDLEKGNSVLSEPMQYSSASGILFLASLIIAILFFILIMIFKFKKKVFAFIPALLILLALNSGIADAVPPVACEFYGTAIINSSSAQTGIPVFAYDPDGVRCGSFTIANSGYYGLISCKGDDPSTSEDEGAEPGDSISFDIENYTRIIPTGDTSWQPGLFKNVNLTYYPMWCGDQNCNNNETCTSCPFDCGECPTGGNETEGNETGGGESGGGEGGGGEGGGGEGGGGGDTQGGGTGGTGGNMQPGAIPEMYEEPCQEEWVCSNWSKCPRNELQTRICVDINNCGINQSKPNETQSCYYPGDCEDGIKNNGEIETDCGGPCPPCASCDDGVWNQGEVDVDCGGPCAPCEQAVMPEIQRPSQVPGTVCGNNKCEKGEECLCMRDCRKIPLELLAIVALCIFLYYLSMRIYLRRYNKTHLDSMERLKKKFLLRRRFLWFLLLSLLFSIQICAYLFLTGSCWNTFIKFILLNLVGIILIPLITYYILKTIEYNEGRKMVNMEKLIKKYNEQLKDLLKIQKAELPRVVKEYDALLLSYKKTEKGLRTFEKYENLDELAEYISMLNEMAKNLIINEETMKVFDKTSQLFDNLKAEKVFSELLRTDAKLKELFEMMEFIFIQFKEVYEIMNELDYVSREYEDNKQRPKYMPDFFAQEKKETK